MEIYPMSILQASTKDNHLLQEAITDYNFQIVPELPRAEIWNIDYVIKNDDGELIGGINAEIVNWGILFISLLFISKKYRNLGYGSKLLKYVEEKARINGCYLSHVDTFDFQGKDFYLDQGYTIFGILDGCPKGHNRYYLKKKLTDD